MPELVRAHVNLSGGGSTHNKFLKALTSVRHLTLWITLPKVVNPSGMIFNQLVHLILCRFAGHCWDLVTCMLQDSPKLRFMKLIDDIYLTDMDIPTVWKPPSSVPECLLHSLKLLSCSGTEEDKEKERWQHAQGVGICSYSFCFGSASFRLNNHNAFSVLDLSS
ncbi:F-box/FBD/LRR-repeat protein [Raphanus sativus]|nr:F-box/FBD/LRR-repeat protein [Raphanus sativus]